MVCQWDSPFDVVVETTGTTQVNQQRLVFVAVHQALSHWAAQFTQVERAADLGHHVTQVNWETRLVHTQAGFAQ